MQIKKIRDDFNLSQSDLSRLLGCHVLTISRWERSVTKPSHYYKREILRLVDELRSMEFSPDA